MTFYNLTKSSGEANMSTVHDAHQRIEAVRNATIRNAADFRHEMQSIEWEIDRLSRLAIEANRDADHRCAEYREACNILQNFRSTFGDQHSDLFK